MGSDRIDSCQVFVLLGECHTAYTDVSTLITFTLENDNSLFLHFPRDRGCILQWEAAKTNSSPTQFRQQFPLQIRAVPVLGPLEQEELLVTGETVKRAAGMPRAARHFRNYWYRNRERFPDFCEMIESTSPGMSIAIPELRRRPTPRRVRRDSASRSDASC